MLTVTVVLAPAANVPLVSDNDTQTCVLPAVQFRAWPPVLLSVYVLADGLNGPPVGPDEIRPAVGATPRAGGEPTSSAAVSIL